MGIVNGYTTLAKVKALALPSRAVNAADDTLLEDLVTQASRIIDTHTRRTFYARSETRYYSHPDGNDPRLLLLDDDLLTVVSLTNGDGTAINAADYFLLPRNDTPKYAIRLRESSDVVWEADSDSSGEYVIAVEGTWGYSASAPADIESACQEIVRAMYNRRFGTNETEASAVTASGMVITPQGLPKSAWQIIEKYRRLI